MRLSNPKRQDLLYNFQILLISHAKKNSSQSQSAKKYFIFCYKIHWDCGKMSKPFKHPVEVEMDASLIVKKYLLSENFSTNWNLSN
ncbi:MAG: hypothetical protein EBS34_13345 [Flavobacteriales bacterium]|nr:hypothetical protein [Flavobacteriales bacterium]